MMGRIDRIEDKNATYPHLIFQKSYSSFKTADDDTNRCEVDSDWRIEASTH